MLARLRFPVARSRGRRYPESEHPYRNAFQRDRDRVVHSRAFRRLEAKTQVFTPGLSDHFRNRLTHTIEVAQIARTLANVLHLDEDLTEALALAHDIGHPPFAHAGEEALNGEMERFGERFDHNLHALRIVESFEQRYARFPGLNLSFEVREGIVKHSHDFGAGESAQLDAYLPGVRPPLEAQLIDPADEVAYNTADLDDAWSAGLIAAGDESEAVPQYREIHEAVETQFPGATERERFHEALRQLIDLLVSGLIEGTVTAAEASGVEGFEEAVLSITGLGLLLWSIIEAPLRGWSSAPVLSAGLAGLAVLAVFIVWERTTSHPMLRPRLFRSRRFSAAISSAALVMFGLFGALFIMTQFLQFDLGYTPLQAGVRILPAAGALAVIAPLSSALVRLAGTKLAVAAGLLCIAAGLWQTSGMSVTSTYTDIVPGMILLGLGAGLVIPAATESVMGSLPRGDTGVGSATNGALMQVGGALGVAVIGSLLSTRYQDRLTTSMAGYHVPHAVSTTILGSLGGALGVAAHLGGTLGALLAQ